MCGRFTLDIDEKFYPRFLLSNVLLNIEPRFNIAPHQNSIVIINDGTKNLAEEMQWGLVPFWAKAEDVKNIGIKMINAKAETLAEKSSFKFALEKRRCLIPMSGFYEWQERGGVKQPFYIHPESDPYFSVAGLYELWTPKDADPEKVKPLKTFTIITTKPVAKLGELHDRMPLLLTPEQEVTWLEELPHGKPGTLATDWIPEVGLSFYPVSRNVNSPLNDGLDLIKPLS
jgi:putative SOS response-associated peptidase YedK